MKKLSSDSAKPSTFKEFLDIVVALFTQKNTDYDSKFTRGLMGTSDPRFLWAWEVEKKLDRIRSWQSRGELLVKDEGIENAVQDAFNYTIMYRLFNYSYNKDPLASLTKADFLYDATYLNPSRFIGYLEINGLIDQDETELKNIITKYMGEQYNA